MTKVSEFYNKVRRRKKGAGAFLARRSGGERAVFIVAFIILAVYSVSLLLPLLWMLMNSFKDGTEYAMDVVAATTLRFPEAWKFSNYANVFAEITYNNVNFFGMLGDSIYFIVVGSGLELFFTTAVSYVISKYKFKGRNFIYSVAIFAMTMPIIGNMASGIKLRAAFGIYDNLLAVFFTAGAGAFGFNFLMLYAFFKSVPWSYAEAVFIDGGNHFTVFFRIMLPLAMPMVTTLFILSAIAGWNDYTTPMLYFPSFPNVAMGLYMVSQTLTRGDMSTYYAALVITTVPVVALFAGFSDKIMKNYSIGGLKG